jgi:CRP-like cAMP-binding protein
MDLGDIISKSYLANGLSKEFCDKIANVSELKIFVDGGVIVHAEDDAQDLMIMASGTAIVQNEVGDQVGKIGPGKPFGEVAFLDRLRRSSTVYAEGECSVVVIAAQPLRALLEAEPDQAAKALYNLARVLCERLRRANQEIAFLHWNDES